MRYFTFAKWLTTKENFNSLTHYKQWLSFLSKDEAQKTDLYYHEKYSNWQKFLQTEWD
nr:hypothetical protein [Clostridium chromiireducens]